MIDQDLKDQVIAEVDAIAPARGDLEGVLRRGRRRRAARLTFQSFGVAAAVGLIGVAGLFGLRSGQPEEGATSVSVTTTTVTTRTMVASLDTPAMERFYTIIGSDQRSSTQGVLIMTLPAPVPLNPPSDVIEQTLRLPDVAEREYVEAARDWFIDEPRETPLLIAGTNDKSGAFTVLWVAPTKDASSDPEFCVAVIEADNVASWTCGEPGLVTQDVEPPSTPSRYTLQMSGAVSYLDDRAEFALPISIGSGNLPLETSYTILVGPNRERWMQRPISGTVLFAIDSDDPTGVYELYAYDRSGVELAVGLYGVSPPSGGPSATSPTEQGDGLSDVDSLPPDLAESLGDGSVVLFAERGLGMAAAPSVEYPDKWDLFFFDRLYDVVLDFGGDYKPAETAELVVRLLANQDDPLVTVYGIAPLGVYELALPFGDQIPDDPGEIEWGEWDDSMIVIDEFYQRPEVDRSVFIGTFDKSLLTSASTPIRFETWFTMSDEPSPELADMFLTFGFQGGRISDSYTGPITTEMFLPPQDLVIDSMDVDSLPTVAACSAPAGVEPPPNQGRIVNDAAVFPTPMAAFEAIMNGELVDSWFPHSGYIELVVPTDQVVGYVKPITETLEDQVVMLIEIQQVDGGWAVTRWEGSGC